MTRLLVSSGTLMSGGAERVLSALSSSFANSFDEVVYLTWIDAPDFYEFDARIKRICIERECRSKNIIRKACWFRNYVRKGEFSLVLSFLEPFNVLICALMMGVNVPLVVADRNDPRKVWNNIFQRNLRKLFYKRAQGIVCQTEHNRCYYKGGLFQKSYVINNPVFLPEEYKGKALHTKKNNRIVSVIRLSPQKNIPMMLRAFAGFHEKHQDYFLTVYGEGESRHELEMLTRQLGVESCVEFPGVKKNVWDLIVDAKCFALSSWYEGMPNALIEAMCLGLPCVSTKVSGAIDFIRSGDNGLLLDLNDEKALVDCFETIASNSAYSDQLGVNATKTYDVLRLDIISNRWTDYLMRFLKRE